jgi:hypothetical protein
LNTEKSIILTKQASRINNDMYVRECNLSYLKKKIFKEKQQRLNFTAWLINNKAVSLDNKDAHIKYKNH